MQPSPMNPEPLQQWYGEWLTEHENTKLIWAHPDKPELKQVHFVRDVLALLLWSKLKTSVTPSVTYFDPNYYGGRERTVQDLVRVVGEHRSKSVRLPVYSIAHPDLGVRLILRYNFYDWNVSVLSTRDVKVNVELYDASGSATDVNYRKHHPNGYRGGYWGNLFFQGFPEEFHFGPFAENPRAFSLAPWSDFELYAFVRELAITMSNNR